MTFTTHLLLVTRLRISGGIPLLLPFALMAWATTALPLPQIEINLHLSTKRFVPIKKYNIYTIHIQYIYNIYTQYIYIYNIYTQYIYIQYILRHGKM